MFYTKWKHQLMVRWEGVKTTDGSLEDLITWLDDRRFIRKLEWHKNELWLSFGWLFVRAQCTNVWCTNEGPNTWGHLHIVFDYVYHIVWDLHHMSHREQNHQRADSASSPLCALSCMRAALRSSQQLICAASKLMGRQTRGSDRRIDNLTAHSLQSEPHRWALTGWNAARYGSFKIVPVSNGMFSPWIFVISFLIQMEKHWHLYGDIWHWAQSSVPHLLALPLFVQACLLPDISSTSNINQTKRKWIFRLEFQEVLNTCRRNKPQKPHSEMSLVNTLKLSVIVFVSVWFILV